MIISSFTLIFKWRSNSAQCWSNITKDLVILCKMGVYSSFAYFAYQTTNLKVKSRMGQGKRQ